jgi:hypothetical protein
MVQVRVRSDQNLFSACPTFCFAVYYRPVRDLNSSLSWKPPENIGYAAAAPYIILDIKKHEQHTRSVQNDFCQCAQHSSLLTCILKEYTNTQELQAKFRDPSSPYHIPPGTKGPEAPDSPSHTYGFNHTAISPSAKAHEHLINQGFDPLSFWEQRIAWGDHDSFQ